MLGKGQRRGEECSVMGARGEGPAEGVGRRQGRGGRAGVREGGPRKVCLRAPTAQHTTRPGSPQGCTNGLPARTGRARQGRRRGYTSPGGRGLVELLAPIGRRRGCRRGRWRRPRRRWRRHEPAPGSGGGTSARRRRRLTRSECTVRMHSTNTPTQTQPPGLPTPVGRRTGTSSGRRTRADEASADAPGAPRGAAPAPREGSAARGWWVGHAAGLWVAGRRGVEVQGAQARQRRWTLARGEAGVRTMGAGAGVHRGGRLTWSS